MIKNAQNLGPDTHPNKYNVEIASRGSKELVVRAHILQEVLRNAQRWVRGYESPDSTAKEYGSLYDCLLLTPNQWPTRYCTTPAYYTNKKGEQSKWRKDLRIAEIAEWYEEHEGLETVSQDLNANVHGAIKRLREDEKSSELIDCSQHSVMVVAEWHDQPTGLIVPLKCLIDIVPPYDHPVFGHALWDTKSTKNASPRQFSKDAQKFGYAIQGAFYCAMWKAATGEERSGFGHIVQENFSPWEYRTPPPLLSLRFLHHGWLLCQRALSVYCRALATGVWPSYDRQNGDWPITDCDDYYLMAETIYDDLEEPEPEAEEEPKTTEEPLDVIP